MPDAPNDWTGSLLSGQRYLITAKLGEGGMGAVYRARDRNIDADVVVKAPLRAMADDPGFSHRFKDEIRSLVKLSHPHIVKISDVGDRDGLPFAVMQFLPGGSLEDRRAAGGGPGRPGDVLGWLPGIAGALDYVHSQRYIHRDVKPGNILFDAQGHAFLSDFGVVKVLSEVSHGPAGRAAMTGTGMVLGTPEYMAPELIMGDAVDGRVDQYALAVTVYEMLCGRRPFEDDVKTKILVLHTTKPPPAPSGFCAWIEPALSDAVLKALAKEPGDRYPTCAAFASAVVAVAGGSAGAGPQRVRFKCGACGRTVGVSPQSYAKIRQSGQPVACPACKNPIDLVRQTPETTPSGQSAARGSTLIVSASGGSGESARPGGGTVALSPKTPSGARPASKTVVERAVAPTKTVLLGGVSLNVDDDARTPPPPAEPAGEGGPSLPAWVPLGAGVAVAILALGGGLVWFTGGKAAEPPGPPVAATPRPASPAPEVKAKGEPVASNPPAAPAPVPAEPPKPPVTVAMNTPETNSAADPAPPPDRENRGFAGAAPAEPKAPPADVEKPGPKPAADDHPDDPAPVFVKGRPKVDKKAVPLEEVMNAPERFAGLVVTLKSTYCLGDSATPGPNGSLVVPVIESNLLYRSPLELGGLYVHRGAPARLLVPAKLAEQLREIGKPVRVDRNPRGEPKWDVNPAIVTVRVAGPGKTSSNSPPEVVEFEILGNFHPRVASGVKTALKVVWAVTVVGANGAQSGYGTTENWAQAGRLKGLDSQLKTTYALNKRVQHDKENAQFASSVSQGLRSAQQSFNATNNELSKKIGMGR